MKIDEILANVPEHQRDAARALLAEYGPVFLTMAIEDAWSYLRRLQAGDLDAVSEMLAKMPDDDFLAKVKANTARWETVTGYNIVRANLQKEFALRVAVTVLSILAAMVGL